MKNAQYVLHELLDKYFEYKINLKNKDYDTI